MTSDERLISQVQIKIDGTELSEQVLVDLIEVVVDTALHLPAMFVIRMHDEALEKIDDEMYAPGATVEIAMAADGGESQTLIKGEITAIEPNFGDDMHVSLTIRGYDRSHRLNRGSKTRAFVQMSDHDIAAQIASEANLRLAADSTGIVHEHVFQHNLTDYQFLQQRARFLGFEMFVEDETLYFRQPRGQRGDLELAWGVGVLSFHPSLSVSQQVDEVIVKGWNPAEKQAIIGRATRSEIPPSVNVGGDGGQVASNALQSAQHVVVNRTLRSQSEADLLAQSILDEINADFIAAEGTALGNPALVAGKKVTLGNLGNRFSGAYMVSAATHTFTQDGYEVYFRVEGAQARTISDLMMPADADVAAQDWRGVVTAIVTNNNDPQGRYRVKVKYPWLDDELESGWIRVTSAAAGPEMGFFWLPEVQDEVLVAFENGDFNYPYIIGGLWNGTDAPPEAISSAVQNGKVMVRTFKTREGHIIRLVDDPAEPHIEIADYDGANVIRLDVAEKKLILKSTGEVTVQSQSNTTIEATGELNIKGSANITVEASGQLNLKGTMVNLN